VSTCNALISRGSGKVMGQMYYSPRMDGLSWDRTLESSRRELGDLMSSWWVVREKNVDENSVAVLLYG
jgi:hypothetical protein